MIPLEQLNYCVLSDEHIDKMTLTHASYVDDLRGMLDLTREEQDQIFLLSKEDDIRLRELTNAKWEPYFPLNPIKEEYQLTFQGKTDEEIRTWLHNLGIPYDTHVFLYGMITTWKMVVRHFRELLFLGGGVDALDGSWRLPTINESGGAAFFIRFADLTSH